jgi:hypothetical protein
MSFSISITGVRRYAELHNLKALQSLCDCDPCETDTAGSIGFAASDVDALGYALAASSYFHEMARDTDPYFQTHSEIANSAVEECMNLRWRNR